MRSDHLTSGGGRWLRSRHISRTCGPLWQDVRYAARALTRTPAFCVAVILTLGAGIGMNAAMFGILDRAVLSPPAGVGNALKVSHLYFHRSRRGHDDVVERGNYPQLVAYREAVGSSAFVAQYQASSVAVERGEAGWIADGEIVSANYFGVLGVTPRLGRFFGDDDENPAAADPGLVISDATWRARFGGTDDVLRKRVWIKGHEYPIIGVAPRGFTGAELSRVDLWLPVAAGAFGIGRGNWHSDNLSYGPRTIIRLATATDFGALLPGLSRAEQTVVTQSGIIDSSTFRAVVAPLAGVRSHDMSLSPESRVASWVFAVSLIVAVIACANVTNLFLLRALSRRREIAIRRALGVSRVRLATTFLGESFLLSLGGLGAAVLAIWVGAPSLRSMLLPRVDWTTGSPVDFRVLTIGMTCAAACAFVAGVLPLLAVNRVDVADVLKTGGPGLSARRLPVQRVLLAVQSGLSLMLLVGAGLFMKSLANARAIRLGFDGEQVISVSMAFPQGQDTLTKRQLLDLARAKLRALPGVVNVARSAGSPFGAVGAAGVFVSGDPLRSPTSPALTFVHYVTPDFFSTLGMRIIRGRTFLASETEGPAQVALVSAAIAREKWPGKEPIGQCFWNSPSDFGKPCTVVVGVVEDAHQFKLVADSMQLLYRPLETTASEGLLLVRTAGRAEPELETIRRTVQAVSPILPPPKVEMMQARVEPLLWQWKLGAWMFPLFGALALVVAALGMYSVLSYAVAQRAHELAVRSALGASSAALLRLVLTGETRTVGIGLAIGLSAALTASHFLTSLLLDTSPRDPAILTGAVGIIAGTALLASFIPARRAACANPLDALRSD